jgi:hypothetical protein
VCGGSGVRQPFQHGCGAGLADLLRPALAGPVQVVATLRPEFLDQLLADPDLAVLPTRVHTLRPLRREALRSVIEGLARLAGIGVDEDLVERAAPGAQYRAELTDQALAHLRTTLSQAYHQDLRRYFEPLALAA